MKRLILAVPFLAALAACAQITDATGLTVEQQLCVAAEAGNANAVEAILAAGLKCLAPVAE